MTLVIKAVSYKGMPPAEEISARFEARGGSIGRSSDNQLVLPDPEKYISRRHAEILYEGGQYFIQDSSAAGTFLEQQDQLLQQSRAVLANGERLRIGEYELQVTIIEPAAVFSQPYAEPVRQLDFASSGPLDGPIAAQQRPAPVADLQKSFIEQPDASIFHQSFTPPEPQGAASAKENVTDDLDFGDLLSTLDNLSSPHTAPISRAPSSASSSLPPDFPELPGDFFAEQSKPGPDFAPAAVASRADSDLPASPFADAATDHADLKTPSEPIPPFQESSFDATGHARQPVVTAQFAPEAVAGGINPQSPAAFAPMPAAAPAEAPQRAHEPHKTVPSDSELIREFLAGAGIDDAHFLPPDQWPALFRTSGELLRSMVDGLMCVLRARAELKSQFRVSVTTMRSVDNNPLKFTPNADDAMRLLLSPTNPGFLTPKEAVREGFADIMNHQMAMTAGIQAALADILRFFDPELIEKAQGEGLQFQKKAKCWEHYTIQYPKLKAAAQEDFFGDAFGDAYEQQMQLLSRSPKR
ncbi:type VI secretion system-associated FHA domain protein TagH [Methylomicrobium sp. Wu6]|uniref:type VI secretion system-associated FHA domain protein TagH n=1 Tax=Methylomicrobium sp. Wu6 TaxID=3107928 RepID=UPI002DD6A0D5|nr:type VI secretion system-associated FHA domain protein TagH [Methylomicrobium sp. Wu6]MEC4750118.1 type VI secretion system-associated FHA domain protein TagH [Methylomicrobium sp. Wu6]